MSRGAFTRAMGSMPSFRNLMYAYVQAFLEQVLVSVACNGAHSLKQRLARWLLMMRDRSDDDTLRISQNLLADGWACKGQLSRMLCERWLMPVWLHRADGKLRFSDRQGLMGRLVNVINWSGHVSRLTFPKHTFKNGPFSVMYVTDKILHLR